MIISIISIYNYIHLFIDLSISLLIPFLHSHCFTSIDLFIHFVCFLYMSDDLTEGWHRSKQQGKALVAVAAHAWLIHGDPTVQSKIHGLTRFTTKVLPSSPEFSRVLPSSPEFSRVLQEFSRYPLAWLKCERSRMRTQVLLPHYGVESLKRSDIKEYWEELSGWLDMQCFPRLMTLASNL